MDLLTPLALAGAVTILLVSLWRSKLSKVLTWEGGSKKAEPTSTTNSQKIEEIKALAECHETAAVVAEMIHKDGAGSWPPRANHADSTWPAPLRTYKEIYFELAPLLPKATASIDDDVNRQLVADFRARFAKLLRDRIDLPQVIKLLQAAEAGRWDVIPRDTYNAFYCCIASCRHAYRWATIPVVKVAQLEKVVHLPPELVEPWTYLQRQFGCDSDAGNNTSNLVLNFDHRGNHVFKINTGMAPIVTQGEEGFARIFYDVEFLGVSIYHDLVLATISWARGDKQATLRHMSGITAQLRPLLGSYYDNMHDQKIAQSVWLSRVQGFFGWGVGYIDEASNEWVKFDGLSGNQVPLFQALDAFLGIEQYLSDLDMRRNVPTRQRALSVAFRKHTFRHFLNLNDDIEARIAAEFNEIAKRLRLFRSAHRGRAKVYLTYPAPERLPMTAGKSLLKENIDDSFEFLDGFMVRRLTQTV
ncbi:hypothetical protein M426DRAFT_323976 [Hypoxylon sp. CI-4A]|nr:hypothetical protein M426DRAFT_323976 [Hypoxylon sp. CI-4A]